MNHPLARDISNDYFGYENGCDSSNLVRSPLNGGSRVIVGGDTARHPGRRDKSPNSLPAGLFI